MSETASWTTSPPLTTSLAALHNTVPALDATPVITFVATAPTTTPATALIIISTTPSFSARCFVTMDHEPMIERSQCSRNFFLKSTSLDESIRILWIHTRVNRPLPLTGKLDRMLDRPERPTHRDAHHRHHQSKGGKRQDDDSRQLGGCTGQAKSASTRAGSRSTSFRIKLAWIKRRRTRSARCLHQRIGPGWTDSTDI